MTWLEDIKVGDKVAIQTDRRRSAEYLIGVAIKVSKSKIEVQLQGYTQTFLRKNGSARKTGTWDIPDRLVEITPEVKQHMAARRLRATLNKRLTQLVTDLPNMTLDQMNRLMDAFGNFETLGVK